MAVGVRTIQDYYEIYKDEVISQAGDLTDFNEGSIHDIIAGTFAIAINEVAELLISEFRKTYFDTAEGGDLDSLAADHFGNRFARPQALRSTVTLTFSRDNTTLGDIIIPRGTVVRTATDAFGTSISFATLEEVILVRSSINVSAQSEDTGASENVGAMTLIEIDSALKDPDIDVTNAAPSAGGTDAQTDFEYRETIRYLIGSLAGATKEAIESTLRAVPGIANATLAETIIPVIPYDIANKTALASAEYFYYNSPVAYVSDKDGGYSDTLLLKAINALKGTVAAGINVDVRGASAVMLKWTAKITVVDGSGVDDEVIIRNLKETMINYVNTKLVIGQKFSPQEANGHVLKLFGESGSNLLSGFETTTPSTDKSISAKQKYITNADNVKVE